LAEYAAEHWVKHVQFEDVSSHIREGMEALFNSDNLYFAAWLRLHDIHQVTRLVHSGSLSSGPTGPQSVAS
jgi:hypothetical protein